MKTTSGKNAPIGIRVVFIRLDMRSTYKTVKFIFLNKLRDERF